MDEKLKKAFEASTSPGHTSIKAFRVKYAVDKNSYSKGIIVLTNCGIDIREVRNAKLKHTLTWLNTRRISLHANNITIAFNNSKLMIETDEFQSFIENLCDVIQRVLTPHELKERQFDKINVDVVNPTIIGILSRLSMFIPLQKQPISPATLDLFETMLISNQPNFNISLFKDSSTFTSVLFELLPLMNFVHSVKIPLLKKLEIYRLIADHILQMPHVKSIEIAGQKDSGFAAFHRNISNSGLTNISYTYSEFSNIDLDLITSGILNSNVHNIEFHNAISIKSIPYFYSDFLSAEMNRHLWSLNLDRTINLDLTVLFQNITNICSLSLSHCGIDINNAISLISLNALKNLKYLNLSGNVCNGLIDPKTKLPGALTHIMVDGVSWNEGSINSFFSLIFKLNKSELHLSIASAIVLPHEWPKLFQFLHRTTFSNLRTLIWDENPVDSLFFDFLSQNTNLTKLSMNGYCHETLLEPLELLANFIKSNNSLEQLFIAGSKKVHLGKRVKKIINACLDKPNLRVLDLSISKCGCKYLPNFLEFFGERSNLEVLIIDGIFPEEADSYVDFLRQAKCALTETKLSFPRGDIQVMKMQKKITQEQLFSISDLYHIPEKVPKQDKVHEYQAVHDSKFLMPMKIYQYFNEPFIPVSLNEREVNTIYAQELGLEGGFEDELNESYEEDIGNGNDASNEEDYDEVNEEFREKNNLATTETSNLFNTLDEAMDLEIVKEKGHPIFQSLILSQNPSEDLNINTSNFNNTKGTKNTMRSRTKSRTNRSNNSKANSIASNIENSISGSVSSKNGKNTKSRKESEKAPQFERRSFYEEGEENNNNENEILDETVSASNASSISIESLPFSSEEEKKLQFDSIISSQSRKSFKDVPPSFTPRIQRLLSNFSRQYKLSDEMECPEFEEVLPNDDVWENINNEISFDTLYRTLKTGKK
ncbi:hypothetical protein TRFO_18056 [Tritrichomonas foetus]|uniref:Leucine Rich Repeat family protein n=1 Tax=Tritrichomonas foetus TaxID=1144522 RepID=A0A1J4KLS2_9EUKA|nr:hypothetical protein TRFO_18056 [Tritrichomonas foetus]|eukprot:OHT12249.1 hypothetical protein TRFO_18056 [Tritrichomonas foetus]